MNKELKGILLVLISAFFYASYGIWSRLMAGAFGEFSQAWTRGLFLLTLILIVGRYGRLFRKIRRQDMKWFLVIAAAGGINQAPYFFGFEHLPIGTATLLFYAALAIGGFVLGRIFFGEKFGVVKLGSLAIGLAGIALIYRLTLSSSQFWPATATIIAGLIGASTVILPKKLTAEYSEPQIMAGYFALQVIFNYPLSEAFLDPLPAITSVAWLPQLGYALSMLIANLAAIGGYSRLEPSTGSLIGMAEIIFGFIFGYLCFGELITPSMLAGSLLIALAALIPLVKIKH